jgi:hypothetical protein
MSETTEAKKADFRNGFSIRDLRDGSMKLGHVEMGSSNAAHFKWLTRISRLSGWMWACSGELPKK